MNKAAERKRGTVPCELCEEPTTNDGTERCDRCYELERRIKDDPGIAMQVIGNLEGWSLVRGVRALDIRFAPEGSVGFSIIVPTT